MEIKERLVWSPLIRRLRMIALVGTIGLACQAQTKPANESADAIANPSKSIEGVWAFVSETNTETGELVRDDSTWNGIWVFTRTINVLFGGRYRDSLVIFRAYRKDMAERLELADAGAFNFVETR